MKAGLVVNSLHDKLTWAPGLGLFGAVRFAQN
jgi:hypothetical protein